jgi:transcription initiation factor TFIIE subunit alpha
VSEKCVRFNFIQVIGFNSGERSEMLMPDNPLVKEYFRKMIGEEGLKIMENLPEREITDEEIAGLTDTKLTFVRKILYTLYENRIAEYRTERDDISGWITYWWSFNRDKVKKLMEEEADGELGGLRKKLEYEKRGLFYQCSCQRISFEEAAEKAFWCDECESNFEYFDNGNLIKELEGKITELEKWKKKLREGH